VLHITPRPGPHRKYSSSIVAPVTFIVTCLAAKAPPGSGRVYLLIKNLPSNGRHSVFCFEALPRNNDVSEPFSSNGCFSGSAFLALSKYATILSFRVMGRLCVVACCRLEMSHHLNRLGRRATVEEQHVLMGEVLYLMRI
jgi:hypothetical protein